jgi:two-component system C4-dicarboxylate transport response regulator DctD
MNAHWDLLVVDDEPVVRSALARVLEAEGWRTACVGSGAEALAHEALAGCRLVICDLMLPGLPGLELMRAIRSRRPGLPILAITGYATDEVAARSANAGATMFLAKPFDHDELLEKVRHVLEQRDVAGKEERP